MIKHNSLRFRYLLSFLMLIILIGVFSLYVCQSYFTMARSYTSQTTIQTFSDAQRDISRILTRCEDLARATAVSVSDNNLVKDDAGHSKINYDSAVFPLLEETRNQLDINVEVLLYIRGDSNVYTISEKLLYDTYVKNQKTGFKLDEGGLYTAMIQSIYPSILHISNTNGSDQIAYVVPVRCSNGATVVVSYLFSYETFTEKIESYLGRTDAAVFIYTNFFKTIYNHNENTLTPALTEIFKVHGSGQLNYKANGKDYVLIREYDTTHNLVFLLCTQEQQFYASIWPSFTPQIILMTILFCALVVLSFVLTSLNYKPIKDLVSDIVGHTSVKGGNELELIRTSYYNSQKEIRDLNAIAINHFLVKLMGNSISSRMEYDYLLLCSGISLSYSHYVFLYLLLSHGAEDSEFEKAQSLCTSLNAENYITISTIINAEHAVCILLCFDIEKKGDSFPIQYADNLLNDLNNNAIHGAQIGIGSICDDPMVLSNSFLEASAAVQLAPIDDNRSIFVYTRTEAKEQETTVSSCINPIQKTMLAECIRRGDAKRAQIAFDDIANTLMEAANSLIMLRFFSTELYNVVIAQAHTCQVQVPSSEIESLLHFSSSREFYERGSEFIQRICEEIQSTTEQQTLLEKSKVVSFLQQNFKDPDLSVQHVSDSLGVSRQHINEILKEDIGQGFAQYISDLRMQEFKRLLLATNATVQDLVQEVGYIDVPNFLRKFKKTEGITPTQYRLINKN